MEDSNIKCPVCCDRTFDSKSTLLEHLINILKNLYCPICDNKQATLVHLVDHLTQNDCQKEKEELKEFSVILQDQTDNIKNEHFEVLSSETVDQSAKGNTTPTHALDAQIDGNEVGKMYVELIGKELMKPCLQTQELKLVKEDGESRYMIITHPTNRNIENTIVTKQNNDGTISLTVKDVVGESDNLTALRVEEKELNQEENIYSCNTCGVSFSSVLEHIQNYHNDQEVVVEEPIDEVENKLTYDPMQTEDENGQDKQISRRVITETGDILEAPLLTNSNPLMSEEPIEDPLADSSELSSLLNNQSEFTSKIVLIEDLENTMEEEKQDKPLACHKVVVKAIKLQNGDLAKMYYCKSCMIYVPNINDFKSKPCKILKYACPHCSAVYENSKSLHAHMKIHKPKQDNNAEAPLTYECELCCTVFSTNKSLKLHKRMHDPQKARPIELPVNSKDGTESSGKRFLCRVCNKLIPIEYLTVHQNSHKTNNMFNCSICNKKFNSNEYLEMHMNVHNLEKVTVNKQDKSLPYNCLYCHRRFARPHEKVKHERIHTGEKPHSCEICGKSFRVSYCLTLHMRTHTGARPYECPHCGKRFKAHSVYNHHLLTHSDVRAYKCPYCPKAFKTSVQLAGHKNSHTKPFSCQHCNRPFASLYAVRVHTETHLRQNNLKFSCSLCGASYARAFALNDHMKQAHKAVVNPTEALVNIFFSHISFFKRAFWRVQIGRAHV